VSADSVSTSPATFPSRNSHSPPGIGPAARKASGACPNFLGYSATAEENWKISNPIAKGAQAPGSPMTVCSIPIGNRSHRDPSRRPSSAAQTHKVIQHAGPRNASRQRIQRHNAQARLISRSIDRRMLARRSAPPGHENSSSVAFSLLSGKDAHPRLLAVVRCADTILPRTLQPGNNLPCVFALGKSGRVLVASQLKKESPFPRYYVQRGGPGPAPPHARGVFLTNTSRAPRIRRTTAPQRPKDPVDREKTITSLTIPL